MRTQLHMYQLRNCETPQLAGAVPRVLQLSRYSEGQRAGGPGFLSRQYQCFTLFQLWGSTQPHVQLLLGGGVFRGR
jgi:hypothetical protein